MRFASTLFVARPTPHEPVPFKEILPLKLKRAVSGKGDKSSNVSCVHEMSVLFACFKVNEFNQNMCFKEIEGFQNCFNNSLKMKKGRKEKEAKGILVPGERKLSHKQLNTLLNKFPDVN